MNHAGILRNHIGFVTGSGFQDMILGTLGEKKKDISAARKLSASQKCRERSLAAGKLSFSGSVKEQSKRRKRTGLLELQIQKMEVFWHRGIFSCQSPCRGLFACR